MSHPATSIDVLPAARVQLTLASLMFMNAQPGEARATVEAVLAQAELPDDLRAEAEASRLLAIVAEGDTASARSAAQAILASGRPQAGRDDTLALAVWTFSTLAWNEGRVADALALARAAVDRSDLPTRATRFTHVHLALARMLLAIGELDDAAARVRKAQDEIDRGNDPLWAAMPSIMRARISLAMGRLDDAAASATDGLEAAHHMGTPLFALLALTTLATTALRRADIDAAEQHLARALAAADPDGQPFGSAPLCWIEAHVCEAREGAEPAFEIMLPLYDDTDALKQLVLGEPDSAPWMVRIAAAVSDARRAASVVGVAERLAADNSAFPSLAAVAAHARGLFERDPALLDHAATAHLDGWSRAWAFEDAGTLLADRGERDAAHTRWQRALAIFEEMGAERDAERMRVVVNQSRGRHHRRHGELHSYGWDSLTDTERRVVKLAGDGLTNRQMATVMFLSRHTIDFHLRQVFRKLAVGSRVQLARLALEHFGRIAPPADLSTC
jgi:DNA-binding CsgD family transcriptional regulator